jgi:tetratricopeptide (TPR) repeat protein
MFLKQSEDRYCRGRQLLAGGKIREATAAFREAIDLESRGLSGSESNAARYHSYYGLCLCLARLDIRQALHQCRLVVRLDRYRPDCWCNLGRVALARKRHGEAYRAFDEGLKIQPDHRGLREGIERLGRRRSPVLPMVARSNPVNILLGLLRNRLGRPMSLQGGGVSKPSAGHRRRAAG